MISKSWARGKLHMQGKQRKQRLAKCRVVNTWIMLGDHEKFYFTMKIAIMFMLGFDPGIPWVRLRSFSCIVGSQKPSNTWGRQKHVWQKELVCSMLGNMELRRFSAIVSANSCYFNQSWIGMKVRAQIDETVPSCEGITLNSLDITKR